MEMETLVKLHRQCVKLQPQYVVELDLSPVMESPLSFAAKLDHQAKVITLNGILLRKSSVPHRLEKFLIFHELAHVLELSEDECDGVAFYALQEDAK